MLQSFNALRLNLRSPTVKFCKAEAKVYALKLNLAPLQCNNFILFASSTQLLGGRWLSALDKKRIDWLLTGVPDIEFRINVNLYQSVQFLSPNQTVFGNFVCNLFPYFFFRLLPAR